MKLTIVSLIINVTIINYYIEDWNLSGLSMPIELEKKKDSNDYPLVAFRISQDEKDEIMQELKKIVAMINENKDDDEKSVRKNKVFVEAMRLGLESIKSSYLKKKKSKR